MSSQKMRQRGRRGVVLSVEALMAATLLFAVLLLLNNLTAPISPPKGQMLENYAQSVLQMGAENNSWVRAVEVSMPSDKRNDLGARQLIDSLPPSVCAQAEVYYGGNQMAFPNWSYVRSGCALRTDTPMAQRIGMVYARPPLAPATRAYDYYWVKVKTYPKEG